MPECLRCGFVADDGVRRCPKCDAALAAQTDGSWRTIDVAHRQETVAEALAKLRSALTRSRKGPQQFVRVIVGSGRIRDEVLAFLSHRKSSREIVDYWPEKTNPGAIVIKLKRRRPGIA